MTAQFSRSAAQFARRTITGRAHERHDLGAGRHDASDVSRRHQRSGAFFKTIIEGSLVVAHCSFGRFARKQRVQFGQFRVGIGPQAAARLNPCVRLDAIDAGCRSEKFRHRLFGFDERLPRLLKC
jgi:hypothetical protein